jgi:curved DNA-binding protein CbpA
MFMIDLNADSHYALLGVAPDADAEEIRAARDRLGKEIKERLRREPTNRDELEKRLTTVNAAGDVLASRTERAKYDQQRPHLRFFTPRRSAAAMFTGADHRVDVLYRAISAHLAAAGVPLRPLSDLDRADFGADAAPNQLLDSLLGEDRQ